MTAKSIIEAAHDSVAAEREYFHVTPTKNVKMILRKGLCPRIGARSRALGELTAGVYLFGSEEEASDAVGNWLGEEFGEDTSLTLLKVRSSTARREEGSFDFKDESCIPPDKIEIVGEV